MGKIYRHHAVPPAAATVRRVAAPYKVNSRKLTAACEGISGINPARFYFPEVEKTALSCYNQHKSEENSEKVENFAKRVEYNDCFTA